MARTLLALALVALVTAGCGGGAKRCPAPPAGEGNAYLPRLSSLSGRAGSTVTIAARLPLFDKAGKYIGPGTPRISAYWNLDPEHWTSALIRPKSATASVAGIPVEYLGTQHVLRGCTFRMQVTVPSVPPGKYPIVLLYRYSDGGSDANGPMRFRVTKR